MNLTDTIKAVQRAVGVVDDGVAGPKTWDAIVKKLSIAVPESFTVIGLASSFADPADVAAFKKCKAKGGSDQDCFKVGDNGIGCWGDDMTDTSKPHVAIRPDDMIAFWGSLEMAKYQEIAVTIGAVTKICIIGDRMPWKKNVKNGAVVDLAPGAQKMFALRAPFMLPCSWRKA